jgi:hypothetical protein
MTKDQIIALMAQSARDLHESGLIAEKFDLTPSSTVFGDGSPLDSIGFVTFVTDVEERLAAATSKDIAVALLDIDNFDESTPVLSVDKLADYLVRLVASR